MTILSAKLVGSIGFFRAVLTRHADPKGPDYTGVFYVGLGDRFDDDRRFVREAGSEFSPAIRPHLGRRFPSTYLSR